MLFTKSYLKPFSDATKLSTRLWRSEVNRRSLPCESWSFLPLGLRTSFFSEWLSRYLHIFQWRAASDFLGWVSRHLTSYPYQCTFKNKHIRVMGGFRGAPRGLPPTPTPTPTPTPAFFRWNFALRRQYNRVAYWFPSDFIEIKYNWELNCLSFLETLYNLPVWFMLRFIGGSEWGYLDNTKHLIFWFCNTKQLNFRYFNINSKKFFEIVNFSQKEAKTAPKRPILFCLVYQGVFGHFTTIPDYFRRFPKISEDYRRGPTIAKDVRRSLQTVISIFFGNSQP